MKIFYIISDKFKSSVTEKNVLTYSEALELIKSKIDLNTLFSMEQGISEKEVAEFRAKVAANSLDRIVHVKSYFDEVSRCEGRYTHKVQPYNTLISDPQKIDGKTYFSLLLVDAKCADLSDHVTGKHLQFMILVEATRQMVNAITEKFYSNHTMIYLANELEISFKGFVYPFKTEMRYSIIDSVMKEGGNGKMKAKIEFFQQDELKCQIDFNFTIMDRNFVNIIENKGLKKTINAA